MASAYIPADLRRLVTERAAQKCEYCLIHQDDTPFTHQVDHIIPQKHGGETAADNLALACIDCNRYKGADLTAFDPASGEISLLFNPRTQKWEEHFALEGILLIGRTAVVRATATLLRLNDPNRLIQRQTLLEARRYG
jgi:CRISPR/Cas system Type II protein with McrA/HNH and RuvC-like nuclease domain